MKAFKITKTQKITKLQNHEKGFIYALPKSLI